MSDTINPLDSFISGERIPSEAQPRMAEGYALRSAKAQHKKHMAGLCKSFEARRQALRTAYEAKRPSLESLLEGTKTNAGAYLTAFEKQEHAQQICDDAIEALNKEELVATQAAEAAFHSAMLEIAKEYGPKPVIVAAPRPNAIYQGIIINAWPAEDSKGGIAGIIEHKEHGVTIREYEFWKILDITEDRIGELFFSHAEFSLYVENGQTVAKILRLTPFLDERIDQSGESLKPLPANEEIFKPQLPQLFKVPLDGSPAFGIQDKFARHNGQEK